jgi:flavin reductase (DIM6/NTAB) family NADH-FMN oxidoreductase RutF
MKISKTPFPALFPCPVVLVSSISEEGVANIITLAYVGVVCSDPPMLGVGIRPGRYSYRLIDDSEEFVVNVPTVDILREVDFCGKISGREVDKFAEMGLTREPAKKVKPPLIKECPVNIECVVKKKIPLGAHHLFIGEVVGVQVDQTVLDDEGAIDFTKLAPLVYNQGEYWNLYKKIESSGFSIK